MGVGERAACLGVSCDFPPIMAATTAALPMSDIVVLSSPSDDEYNNNNNDGGEAVSSASFDDDESESSEDSSYKECVIPNEQLPCVGDEIGWVLKKNKAYRGVVCACGCLCSILCCGNLCVSCVCVFFFELCNPCRMSVEMGNCDLETVRI